MSPRTARLALSLICEPGDPRLPVLLATIDPLKLVDAIRAGRRVGGVAFPTAWMHGAQDVDADVDRVLDRADAAGLRWIVPGDTAWPQRLDALDHVEQIAGATGMPLGLWVRGERSLADLVDRSVAIVGARDCTVYGAEVAGEIAADASSAGFVVVSGAAYGIDACAHRGALATLSPTVAVLACDAATDYPRAHAALLNRIADEGLVVSEQPPGQVPTKARFLSRNRIIAALAEGTLVVEARRRSGALNTLAWADQLGRPTMAVPGPVTSQHSVGTHQAIRDGKAVLVSTGQEVVSALSGFVAEVEPVRADDTAFDRLTSVQARVLDALEWTKPLGLDELSGRAGLGRESVGRALADLVAGGWAAPIGRAPAATRWLLVRRADLESPEQPRTVGE
jgi:DNA processing protein